MRYITLHLDGCSLGTQAGLSSWETMPKLDRILGLAASAIVEAMSGSLSSSFRRLAMAPFGFAQVRLW